MLALSRCVLGQFFIILWLSSQSRSIESPQITDWGEWGPWDRCPKGSLVNRMQLKVEQSQGDVRDDTALNGIRFFCSPEDGSGNCTHDEKYVTSSVGNLGTWGEIVSCPADQFAVGFELRSEESLGMIRDDTAANNVRLICEDGTGQIPSNGQHWGVWTQPQKCGVASYLCGIRTQVEVGGVDKSGLNNLEARCCWKVSPSTNMLLILVKSVDEEKDFYRKKRDSAEIIRSPRTTNWGDWGPWDLCPAGALVNKMQLKVETDRNRGDDSALNGIRFFCTQTLYYASVLRVETITSVVGDLGTWGEIVACPSGQYAVGFELRSEGSVGYGDDTAANNLRLICEGGTRISGPNGQSWGVWTQSQSCSRFSYICGIKTQVEPRWAAGYNNFGDDTALNNLDALCCPKPSLIIRLEATIFKIDFHSCELNNQLKFVHQRKVSLGTRVIYNNGTESLSREILASKAIIERYQVDELFSLLYVVNVSLEGTVKVTNMEGIPFLAHLDIITGLRMAYMSGAHGRGIIGVAEIERRVEGRSTVTAPPCSKCNVDVSINFFEYLWVDYDLWLRVSASVRTDKKDAQGQFIWDPAPEEFVKNKLQDGLEFVRNEGDGRTVSVKTDGSVRINAAGDSVTVVQDCRPTSCNN